MARTGTRTAKAAKKVATALPEGLDELEATIRIPAEEFDGKGFVKAFPAEAVGPRRVGEFSVATPLRGKGDLSDGHAHFSVRHVKKASSVVCSVSLVPGEHSTDMEDVPTISEAIAAIRKHWPSASGSVRILLSAHYNLDMKKWSSTLQLPFVPSAMTGTLGGLPQICGVDIAFHEPGEGQSLKRAFVTTYDGIDEMVVRMLMVCETPLDASFVSRVLAATHQHLPLLAKPRPKEGR